MIDWLEELLKAAEEGLEFDLSARESAILFSAKTKEVNGADLDDDTAKGELLNPVSMEIPAWKNRRGALGQPGAVGANVMGTDVRSALGVGKHPEDGSVVQRLYRSTAGSGLTALYRRVRETVSLVQPAMPGRGNTVVVREEVSAAPGLTEKQLDRSLRRDSRRYDGDMSIY